jgi:Ca-activated chloride channel family protein
MRQNFKILILLIINVQWLFIGTATAQPETYSDQTLSPHFLVKSDDPEIDQLPLKSTSAVVNISGVIADVTIIQIYKNEGSRPLEAIYVFPASTRAAVYGMKMTIGERTITAKIHRRKEARQVYETAKQAGKRASLLEQHRPNVFQMNVANILAGDTIRVELKYTELLVPTDRVYTFVYPTVVGPRYSETPAKQAPRSEKWVENPYLHQDQAPPYTFDFSVNLTAGLPIQNLTCPSHRVDLQYLSPDTATLRLHPAEGSGGNRDFILKYRLAGEKIETGMLLSGGQDENFFLLMVQPPKRVLQSHIPPREYIFIVDVSGSMHGFPLDMSKNLLKDLITNLRSTDRFNVLLFAGGSSVLAEKSLAATPNNIQHAIQVIEGQRGGGGTRLLPAMKRALSIPKIEGYSRTVVVATDGYVSVEEQVFDLMRNRLGDANMFTFGIGSSVNRHLIEGMARVGMGEPFVITHLDEAAAKAEQFRKLIQSPVLTTINVDFGKFEVFDVEPLSIPDVMADRPVIIFGKYRGRPKGAIEIRGISGDHNFVKRIKPADATSTQTNLALRYLWARYRISLLADYNRLRPDDERIEEVTQLGLHYNLLTAYTSFVAVDSRVRLTDGQTTTVRQPLPLPRGVSDYAVGHSSLARKRISSIRMAAPSAVPPESYKKIPGIGSGKVEQRAAQDAAAEKEAKPLRLFLKKLTVSRGLSKRYVQRRLEKQLPQISLCYDSLVKNRPRFTGSVEIEMIVDSSGNIEAIKAGDNGKKNRNLEKCIRQFLKKLQFPKPKNAIKVAVMVTFVLK